MWTSPSRAPRLLAGATAGLHTMVDEHRYLRRGVHGCRRDSRGAQSAGPAMDIVVPAFANDGSIKTKAKPSVSGFHGGGVRGVHAPRCAWTTRRATRRARARARRAGEARLPKGRAAPRARWRRWTRATSVGRTCGRGREGTYRADPEPEERSRESRRESRVGVFSPRKRGTRGADGGKSLLKPKRLQRRARRHRLRVFYLKS